MASGKRCALKRGTPRILGVVLVGYPEAHEQGAGVRASQFPTALSCGFWVQFFGLPGMKDGLGVHGVRGRRMKLLCTKFLEVPGVQGDALSG